MTVLFVVGPPGAGKTAVVRELLEPDSYFVQKPKWTVGTTVCAAGHYLGNTFDGADTVPYNGVQDALAFWAHELRGMKLTIFDGDRFSHEKALTFVRQRVDRVMCLHLAAPTEVLEKRRAGRGSNQNATWMKGRATKARKFAELFSDAFWWEQYESTPKQLADEIRKFL